MRIVHICGAVLIFLLVGAAPTPQSFVNVAKQWGFTVTTAFGGVNSKESILESTGGGAAVIDLDGDGKNELVVVNGTTLDGRSGPGTFLYSVKTSGGWDRPSSLGPTAWSQAVCAGDIDNDGDPDIAITAYGINRLYINSSGTLTDKTAIAGLPTLGSRWGSGCAFTDFDRDGWLDLFIANYVDLDLATAAKPGSSDDCIWRGLPVFCGPKGLKPARNVLYRNRGDGTFEDVSERSGILKPGPRFGLGVAAADFNDDGWPDIYVACDQTPSLLYENQRNGTFKERGDESGVAYNFDGRLQSGMGVAVGDFNGDGRLDIAKTNFSGDLPSLYLNEDGRFFRDVSRESGLGANQLLGWGIAFTDIDDDGRPDLIIVNGHVYPEVERAKLGDRYRQPTLLYRNIDGKRFADVSKLAGDAIQAPLPARGLALGDLDGDGRPEFVVNNMNETPAIFKNTGPRRHWLRIELRGTKSNRSAIGSRVTVRTATQRQTQELMSGSSYYSQHEMALYFGLADATRADIQVRWPNGQIQDWKNVLADRTVRLVEGSAVPATP